MKKYKIEPNGPELWTKVLNFLSEYYSYRVIAGGCVRDYFLNKPPKDIDVFVRGKIKDLNFKFKKTSFDNAYQGNSKDDIKDVLYFNYQGYLINIIVMKSVPDIKNLCDGFDFNICRSGFYETIYDDPLAKIDRENKTLTINDKSTNVTEKRFYRLNKSLGGGYKLRGQYIEKINIQNELPPNGKILSLDKKYLNIMTKYKAGFLTYYQIVHQKPLDVLFNLILKRNYYILEYGPKFNPCNDGYRYIKYINAKNIDNLYCLANPD